MGSVVREQQHARRRRASLHEQPGFTMVELTIVVLVIGILVAVAIPTFLGSRSRAQNRAAQSDLRSALVAAKASYANVGTYTCAVYLATVPCPSGLPQLEPSLTFAAGDGLDHGFASGERHRSDADDLGRGEDVEERHVLRDP